MRIGIQTFPNGGCPLFYRIKPRWIISLLQQAICQVGPTIIRKNLTDPGGTDKPSHQRIWRCFNILIGYTRSGNCMNKIIHHPLNTLFRNDIKSQGKSLRGLSINHLFSKNSFPMPKTRLISIHLPTETRAHHINT